MDIIVEQNQNAFVFKLSGRLDTTTSPQLEAKVKEHFSSMKELVFDLKELAYLSSAGLRVLLMAQKHMNKTNGHMVVRNAGSTIREIFEITGFNDILEIE